jgi:PBP1b-binding outer membrane lipoprotein LpoB
MNKTKVILTALIGIIILSSCSAVKSGLSGRKENNTDEFLVKKKSPLSLPPKFEELPIPSSEDLNDSKQKKSDIQNLIMSGSQKNNKQTSKNQSIEEFISGKIKED